MHAVGWRNHMRTVLEGTEIDTLELDGLLPAGACTDVPALLDVGQGPVGVNILFCAMRGLRLRGLPWPRFDYHEALWRISVQFEGAPAWYAIACDLDSPVIRGFGRRVVRYPTRVARFTGSWTVEAAGGALSTRAIEGTESPAPVPPRRTFVRDGAHVYEIPWQEIAAPERHLARVDVLSDSLSQRTFGEYVTWASLGLVHRGRIHRCGVAHRSSIST